MPRTQIGGRGQEWPRVSSMMPARVRGHCTGAWSTVCCMVSSARFGEGWELGPCRAHSRLGGGRLAPACHQGVAEAAGRGGLLAGGVEGFARVVEGLIRAAR